MTRCPDECGKKWKTGRQTKPGWKKQEERQEEVDDRRGEDDSKISGGKRGRRGRGRFDSAESDRRNGSKKVP